MTKIIKSAFHTSTLGFFKKTKADGPSEAEEASQDALRLLEEQRQAELLSRGPSRITGRSRRVGRALLAFAGSRADAGGRSRAGGGAAGAGRAGRANAGGLRGGLRNLKL